MKLKEKYGNEIPRWLRNLGAWRVNSDSIDFGWGYFAPRFGFDLLLDRSYNEGYITFDFNLIWGKFSIYLKWFKPKFYDFGDSPRYGFYLFDRSFVLCWGQKSKHFDLPFFTYTFESTEIMGADGEWIDITKRPDRFDIRDSEQVLNETFDFTYTLKSGKVQKRRVRCTKERWSWHRKWFPFLKKVRVDMDMSFSDEVGERSGSWKGGVVGTSEELKPNETLAEAIRRVERDRKF